MDEILKTITKSIPHLVPLITTLSVDVYKPIMAGERPGLKVDQLMAKYPGFFSTVQDQIRFELPCRDLRAEALCGSPLSGHDISRPQSPDVHHNKASGETRSVHIKRETLPSSSRI